MMYFVLANVRIVTKCYKVALPPYSRARIVAWPRRLASTSSVYRVAISLMFLLCSQNDCINSAVGDSDIGSGVSVTVLWFAVSLWFVANFVFVGTCRRVHLAFGLH